MRHANRARTILPSLVLVAVASGVGGGPPAVFAQAPPAGAAPPPAPPVQAPQLVAQVTPTTEPSLAARAASPPAEAKAASSSPPVFEAIIAGKVSAGARYRYEYLDRQDTGLHARASTLRVVLGYETKPVHGLSLFGQFEGATNIGPRDWRVPTADPAYKQNNEGENPRRPLVADAVGNEVSQAFVKYAASWLTVKLGRQELMLNNGRIISVIPWRQRNQTMDAVNVEVAPVKGANVNYAFITQANRVVGADAIDGQLKMSTHVGNVTYKNPGIINLALFDVYLDYRDLPQLVSAAGVPMVDMMRQPVRVADGSTNTIGGRVEGPYKLSDAWAVLYSVELAQQTDVGDNPLAVDAVNYGVELGLAYQGLGLRAQYNVRSGTKAPMTGEAFQTPLAHSWDGWTENFSRTPKAGLRLLAAHLTGPVPSVAGLALTVAYFEYFAHTALADGTVAAGDHYGREVDFGLEYRFVGIDKNWLVGGRFAYYAQDELPPAKIPNGAANLRTSIYTSYAF